MPRKANEKLYFDYNIYRIPLEHKNEFIDFLESRHFEKIPLRNELIPHQAEFSFELMFCDKENQKGSPWVKLLSACSNWELIQELRIYGAALICVSRQSCFIVSYGNAHFYISDFCDYNFGVEVAERLIDLNSVKAQQNISHGTRLSKTHMDYLRNSILTYGSGEIPTYIRGKSINEDEWGQTINCGISAQFKWTETPLQISKKLSNLEIALNSPASISLPRLTPLDDDIDTDKIESLYKKLAAAIENFDESSNAANLINVPSFYLIGTKIIQNDFVKYKISCNHKRKEVDGELDILHIKDFMIDSKQSIQENIRCINIAVDYGTDQWTPLRPITEYLEFITEDNFCLRNGKWCSFNTAYTSRILEGAQKIAFYNHIDDDYFVNKTDLVEFAKTNNFYIDCDNQPYETYYNHYIAQKLGATCLHPDLIPFDDINKKYRLEPCDLYLQNTLFFVKIGQPGNFAYAVDQALLTLDKIESENGKLTLKDGTVLTPNCFRLILIFENRVKKVEQWKDIGSLNFLIHLNELRNRLNSTGIRELIVDFIYF